MYEFREVQLFGDYLTWERNHGSFRLRDNSGNNLMSWYKPCVNILPIPSFIANTISTHVKATTLFASHNPAASAYTEVHTCMLTCGTSWARSQPFELFWANFELHAIAACTDAVENTKQPTSQIAFLHFRSEHLWDWSWIPTCTRYMGGYLTR